MSLKRKNTERLAIRIITARANTTSITTGDNAVGYRRARQQIVEAVRLSVLSSPNQQDVMVGREIFGVSHWELLPLELQQRTGADLAAELLAEREIADLRLALAGKSEKTRNEILAVLQTEGVPAKDLVAIGF
jgi:hypothetical protein